jgi:hypothetical protein
VNTPLMTNNRMKPLPLTSPCGRHTTAATERTPVSVGEWPLHVSELNSSSAPRGHTWASTKFGTWALKHQIQKSKYQIQLDRDFV